MSKTSPYRLSYHSVFKSAGDAILLWEYLPKSNSFIIIDTNRVACRRYGYSRSEMMGLSSDNLNSQESLVTAKRKNFVSSLFRNGNVVAEIIHKTKDGHLIPTEVNASLIHSKGKSLVLSLCRDISPRKEEEKKREELLVDILLNKRLDELLNRIEHAKVEASLEHSGKSKKLSDLHLAHSIREITINDRHVSLTPIEGSILSFLLSKPGRCISYAELANLVWRRVFKCPAKMLRIHLANLRGKIETNPHQPTLILTKPGKGYYISKPR